MYNICSVCITNVYKPTFVELGVCSIFGVILGNACCFEFIRVCVCVAMVLSWFARAGVFKIRAHLHPESTSQNTSWAID